jgi:CHAP domain
MSAGRRLRLWPAGLAAGVVISAFLVVAAVIAALFGASATCLGTTTGGVSGSAPTTKAAREIPEARLHIFVEAGRRFDVSWPFLASIGVQECGADGHCGVAESGCAGVMEIAYVRGSACSPDASVPTLWERFRVDGDGDGQTSIFDPADAIFTAARIFRQSLGAPPTGGPYHGYYEAACGYYGACSDSSADYAPEVMARAVSFGFGHEGGDTADLAANDGPPAPAGGPSCGASVGGAGGGASGAAIVRIARSQIGTPEVPLGSNCTKYGPCEEWCALFATWVWQHAGVPIPSYPFTGSIYSWAASRTGVLPPTAAPSVGDAVLYGTGPSSTSTSLHVGVIVQTWPDGAIVTIEGDAGPAPSGSLAVVINGPYLPSQSETYNGMPIYAYAVP